MKNLLFIVAASLLLLPRAQSQSLTVENSSATQPFGHYSTANFLSYRGDHETNSMTKVGTIMSSAGIITGVIGAVVLINSLNLESENVDNQLATGLIVFIAGGVVGITGGSLALSGLMRQHHHRYGFQLVTPKANQVGLACNF